MIFTSLVGERLKETRKSLGFSQAEMAEAVGVTREHWGRYERGALMPGGEVLAALAANGMDINYILTGQRSLPPPTSGLREVPSAHPPPSDEQKLLADYRACDAAGRAIIRAASQAAAKAASTPASAHQRRRAG